MVVVEDSILDSVCLVLVGVVVAEGRLLKLIDCAAFYTLRLESLV